ncbi:hypothetical protein F5Y06DRAFT_306072 [Hypoxylon sp. FL0890]|nr:hypothetical protein F5Y06DRAFT_306072 [Hypoxylon sp. FL0890]
MLIQTLPISHPLTITAEPLTPTAFSPFGSVLTNPAPERRPHNTPASALPSGYGAVSANQGTAIQYRALAPPLRNLYDQAPSRKPGTPRTTMFVCGARELLPDEDVGWDQGREKDKEKRAKRQKHKHDKRSHDRSTRDSDGSTEAGFFPLLILERHPYTTQTFIPLGASARTHYLVIVAPSLPPDTADKDLPVPTGEKLPGRGLPDLHNLRAFISTGTQAVTYGAGTWHAPMAALGAAGSAIEFVVVQFANDEPAEDCQEVALEGRGSGEKEGGKGGRGEKKEKEKGREKERKKEEGGNEDVPRIMVRVPLRKARLSKL